MTLKECYGLLGGDYDDAIGRLRSERLVQKFVLKFPDDGSYALLLRSLEEGDKEEAFRAAHTIKGVAQNLSFTELARSSSALTELLRAGDLEGAKGALPALKQDYIAAVTAIGALKESLGA